MQDTTKKVVSWTDPETWSSIESSNENTVLRNEPSGDRAVKATRLVLVLLLLVSAGALGWATYYITNGSTAANFNQNVSVMGRVHEGRRTLSHATAYLH